jgi:hypothetical protein
MQRHLRFLFNLLRQNDPVSLLIAADYANDHAIWNELSPWAAQLSTRRGERYLKYCLSNELYGSHERRWRRIAILHNRLMEVFAYQFI